MSAMTMTMQTMTMTLMKSFYFLKPKQTSSTEAVVLEDFASGKSICASALEVQ